MLEETSEGRKRGGINVYIHDACFSLSLDSLGSPLRLHVRRIPTEAVYAIDKFLYS